MKTWWVSFSGETEPLGVVIVDAVDPPAALEKIVGLGLCPGGEAMFLDMSDPHCFDEINRWGRDRLIAPAELDAASYQQYGELELDDQFVIDVKSKMICETDVSKGME